LRPFPFDLTKAQLREAEINSVTLLWA